MLNKILRFLKSLFTKQADAIPTLPVGGRPIATTREELPWMAWAERELGVSELENPERIKFYHSFTKLPRSMWHSSTAWCASFMSACLENAGMKAAQTARARDFLHYGTPLEAPKYGCIVVYKRDGGGHVHFFIRESGDLIYGLGGNQNNTVCVKAYRKADVLGYRWPTYLKSSVKVA